MTDLTVESRAWGQEPFGWLEFRVRLGPGAVDRGTGGLRTGKPMVMVLEGDGAGVGAAADHLNAEALDPNRAVAVTVASVGRDYVHLHTRDGSPRNHEKKSCHFECLFATWRVLRFLHVQGTHRNNSCFRAFHAYC